MLGTFRWQLDEQESYQRLEQELAASRERYRHLQEVLRQQLEQLPTKQEGAGIELGLFRPTAEEVRAQQRGLLVPGHVEAGAAWRAAYTAHLLDVTGGGVVLTSSRGPGGAGTAGSFGATFGSRATR
ncbi:MAG: type 4a pilus biogenesis protein PilO [Chloroflexi bacterium]|nr:type 4a pilus biogenesis protein PilO [Chloroflexota bacterium]